MKIVHVSTHDIMGGAARAAYRLHVGLCHLGQESAMFVSNSLSNGATVQTFSAPVDFLSRLRRRLRRKRINRAFNRYRETRPAGYEQFSDDRTQYGAAVPAQLPECDVVNLHWVAGFVDYPSFYSRVGQDTPIVWTLHDMNPFTGGCHYDHGCGRFASKCGACPQLGSEHEDDLSRQVWKRKRTVFEQIPTHRLHVITPSRWLADEAESSPLLARFPVTVIPYGIDIDTFVPHEQACAREVLRIPSGARVVLFAAHFVTNRRKGFALMDRALEQLAARNDVLLLSMGKGAPVLEGDVAQLHLGHVKRDLLLAAAYSAADVFVMPSLQDNLPNTVLESMACGTPVVGFDVGGIPDMVRPGVTGLLAPAGDVRALSEAIARLLDDDAQRMAMAAECRRVAVEEYGLEVQARRYVELYERILED